MNAGEMVGAWRKARGLKQREAAALFGCSQAMLGKLESNGSLPGVELAVRIERATENAVPCEAWKRIDGAAGSVTSGSGEHPIISEASEPDAAGSA